jgi:hypothetical protein
LTVDGTIDGRIEAMNLPHGGYKLAAIDLANEVKGESSFSIWFFDFDIITLVIIVVIATVALGGFVYYKKYAKGGEREKETEWEKLYKKYR